MDMFSRLSAIELSEQISAATNRIIYATPGIHKTVSNSIINMIDGIDKKKIHIIIDSDPEVCRLGYGDIESVESLLNNGINIRKIVGLRIGLLIVDRCAWLFSPTPLLIEDDFKKPYMNAVSVTVEQGIQLMQTISPDLINEQDKKNQSNQTVHHVPDIGMDEYIQKDLANAKKDLDQSPPKKFDFERKVHVYNRHVQFVELSLTGIQLNRRTLTIPAKLLNVSNDKTAQERIKATYSLINQNNEFSSKEIEQKLSKLRKTYIKPVGKRLGNIILRKKKEEFKKEIDQLKVEIEEFSTNVRTHLEKELEKSKKELCTMLLPGVMNNPPDDLKGVLLFKKPDRETAIEYLNVELEKVIPTVDELIEDINLYCDFKNITYEMLNDQDFQTAIRHQFPFIPWPTEKHMAVQEINKQGQQMELALDS